MEDGPRYYFFEPDGNLESALRDFMRPGDRIVSIFPTSASPSYNEVRYMRLRVLLELRHPSWAKEGVGWVPGNEAPTL
jgi:hypothetical protein